MSYVISKKKISNAVAVTIILYHFETSILQWYIVCYVKHSGHGITPCSATLSTFLYSA